MDREQPYSLHGSCLLTKREREQCVAWALESLRRQAGRRSDPAAQGGPVEPPKQAGRATAPLGLQRP